MMSPPIVDFWGPPFCVSTQPPLTGLPYFVCDPYQRLVGQRLDENSNLCQNSVETLSDVYPIARKVQSLSSKVQGLSNECQDFVKNI